MSAWIPYVHCDILEYENRENTDCVSLDSLCALCPGDQPQHQAMVCPEYLVLHPVRIRIIKWFLNKQKLQRCCIFQRFSNPQAVMIANQELELNFYWLLYYGAKPGYNYVY